MRSDIYEGITKEVNKFLKKYPDYEVEMTESPTGNMYFKLWKKDEKAALKVGSYFDVSTCIKGTKLTFKAVPHELLALMGFYKSRLLERRYDIAKGSIRQSNEIGGEDGREENLSPAI